MAMHRLFADWYSAAQLDPSPELLTRRWACVEKVTAGLQVSSALDVVRFFLGIDNEESSANGFVDSFKKVDSSFPAEGNRELLHVMLGAVAANTLVTPEQNIGTAVALALRASQCHGIGQPIRPASIASEAEHYLLRNGIERRQRALAPPKDLKGVSVIKEQPAITRAAVADAAEWGVSNTNDKSLAAAVDGVAGVVEALRKTVATLQTEVNTALGALQKSIVQPAIPVLQEETEILWWLFAARSVHLECPFSRIPFPGSALVVARELAERTTILPAPPSADAFLIGAMGGSSEGLRGSLAEIIASTPLEWRKSLAARGHHAALTPVMVAIVKSCDGDASSWHDSFENVARVNPNDALTAVSWSRQLYDELLLLSAVPHAKV